VEQLLQAHQTSLDVEVQQRAVEYGNLFAYGEIRLGVLEKMPPPQIKESSRVLGEATKKTKKSANRKSKLVAKPTTDQDLLDLMGDSTSAPLASPTNGAQSNTDLLADILGGSTSPTTSPPPQSANTASIMDLFSQGPAPSTQSPAPPGSGLDVFGAPPPQQAATPVPPAGLPCYDANGLKVTLQLQRNAEGAIQVAARFSNFSAFPLSNVGLQAAVPKTQKLQLMSISNSDMAPGAEATQTMRILGSKGVRKKKSILLFGRRPHPFSFRFGCANARLCGTAFTANAASWLHPSISWPGNGSGEMDGALIMMSGWTVDKRFL
jgi:AP-1 complex subunit gamma-1